MNLSSYLAIIYRYFSLVIYSLKMSLSLSIHVCRFRPCLSHKPDLSPSSPSYSHHHLTRFPPRERLSLCAYDLLNPIILIPAAPFHTFNLKTLMNFRTLHTLVVLITLATRIHYHLLRSVLIFATRVDVSPHLYLGTLRMVGSA
jgi:hypothetical protein